MDRIAQKKRNYWWMRPISKNLLIQMIFFRALAADTDWINNNRFRLFRGFIIFSGLYPHDLKKLEKTLRTRYEARRDEPNLELFLYYLFFMHKYTRILRMQSALKAASAFDNEHIVAIFRYAQYEAGYFNDVSAAATDLCIRRVGLPISIGSSAIIGEEYVRGSYAAAMADDKEMALQLFACHYGLDDGGLCDDGKLKRAEHRIIDKVINECPAAFFRSNSTGEKISIFLHNAPDALGHTILDLYHFLALYRECYDDILFVGGPLTIYDPGPKTCIEIGCQYGQYLETHNQPLLNLSWMAMGHFSLGNVTVIVENYWSLLREVYHRTRDPDDDFEINAWHMTLPEGVDTRGRTFCSFYGIDPDRPIVTLHARDQKYHKIAKQNFRNSPINDYEPAIHHLLDQGYQVIRLGDQLMPKLPVDHVRYFEIPFLEKYDTALDPFFIDRSDFLIGSQSGPCSYARALGVPVLSVNAVFSYTLLPSVREMACFKTYLRTDEQGREHILDYNEIMADNIFQMENADQLELAGISVRNCTSAEIEAAIRDMIAWVSQPDLALTTEQIEFRDLVERTAERIKNAPDNIPKIADYLGIALPGYRVSPSVEKIRRPSRLSDGAEPLQTKQQAAEAAE